MKSFYSFLLALLLLAGGRPAAAQVPAWQSARVVAAATAAMASNFSEMTATAVDGAGNVFVAGNFTNTVVLGGTTLTSHGSGDVFVAKFNPASNQFVWVQQAGGTGGDKVNALAVSGNSVYVTGFFTSPVADFGATALTNAGTYDVFVAKLVDAGSTGSFAWAQRAGGQNVDIAYALAVSGTSVYVAGYFGTSPASFGATTLTTAGHSDVFVAKLTDAGSTGSFAWAQRAGGTTSDNAYALAVSGNSVYVAGYFASPTAHFGTITLTNTGSTDTFVVKLTDAGSTGSFVWAQRTGGPGYDIAYALAVNGTSVYMAGSFGDPTADFGPTTLTSEGATDVFIAKLIDAGSTSRFTWAQRAGGTSDDQATALAVSNTSVYVAGTFNSPPAGFGAATLTNAGSADVFAAKLTDAGSFVWAQRAGGTTSDNATALALSSTSVYVAGYFNSSTAGFGATTLTNSNPNSTLGFLAALADPTLTATTTAQFRTVAQLFPNPAQHTATLRLPAGTPPAPLTLTNAQGRAVRRYPAPAGPTATLDLRGLPAGLYLLGGAGRPQRLLVE